MISSLLIKLHRAPLTFKELKATSITFSLTCQRHPVVCCYKFNTGCCHSNHQTLVVLKLRHFPQNVDWKATICRGHVSNCRELLKTLTLISESSWKPFCRNQTAFIDL